MRGRRSWLWAGSLVLLLAAGCTTGAGPPAQVCDGETWFESRLYFGRSIPGGGEVGDDDWQDFLESSVVPRFPDGFTVLAGTGYWREAGQVEPGREKSSILVILHEAEAASDQKIVDLTQDYLTRFRQEAVLRSDRPVCVVFYGRPAGS